MLLTDAQYISNVVLGRRTWHYLYLWQRSVVVSALASINVVNRHWARLVLGYLGIQVLTG